MLTYKSLEIVNEGSKDQGNKKSNDITHKHIENMQKSSGVTVLRSISTKDSLSLC